MSEGLLRQSGKYTRGCRTSSKPEAVKVAFKKCCSMPSHMFLQGNEGLSQNLYYRNSGMLLGAQLEGHDHSLFMLQIAGGSLPNGTRCIKRNNYKKALRIL